MNVLLVLWVIYISFRVGLDVYESLFIKEEVAKQAVLMNQKEYIQAGLYAVYQRLIDIFDAFISLFVVVTLLSGGLWLINFFDGGNSLLSIFSYFAIVYILSLPVSIYRIIIDKRFDFYNGGWKMFVIDEIKKIALFLIFGGIFFYGLVYFIDHYQNWWIIAFVFVFVVIVLVNLLLPFFMSIFNKFTPLEDEELKQSIQELLCQTNFKSDGIFVMDASKRDSRLNAFFSGLGSSKRVVLFDTLLNKLTKEEILAVLAHELGHFRNKDIYKNIIMIGMLMFGLLFIVGHLPDSLFTQLKLEKNAGNIIVLGIIISEVYFYFATPIVNLISRTNEFNADAFSTTLVDAKYLKNALIKLIKQNKAFPKSSKLFSIMYHSHPNVLERIEKLDKTLH
ncbi:MAG: M48 family metallopeptidase [Epsilonproteobacteria bacterium]|nr:M48 family metallopeptidase [Campylobacterota bacterium]